MPDVAGSCWGLRVARTRMGGLTFTTQRRQRALQDNPHVSMAGVGESQDGMYGSSSPNAVNSVDE
jgi:hypothetical protein